MSYAKIRPRRGTLYEWSTLNPLLDEGELVVEYPESGLGNGFCKFKIGDGQKRYNDLAYAFDGATASTVIGGTADSDSSSMISIRGDNPDNWDLNDPVLGKNEIVYDSENNCLKVGDGVHKWSELPYINAGGTLGNVIECGDEDNGDWDTDEDTLGS